MRYPIQDSKDLANAPKWVQLMTLIGRRIHDIPAEGHISCVLAPPTVNYFPGALAIASVTRGTPLEVSEGVGLGNVASLKADILIDAEHTFNFNSDGSASAEYLGMAKYKEGTFPPMYKLPEGFPIRSTGNIPKAVLDNFPSYLPEKNQREACWSYFELCANPVVIICQHPGQVAAEVEELVAETDWWLPEQVSSSIEPGTSPDDWYRRPIICISPRALQHREWLKELSPAAVIVIGYSAWETPARWFWPDLPHTLFLDSRSDDILRFRLWHDGQDFPLIHSEFAELKGIAGIPAKFFSEPPQTDVNLEVFDWDEYGADFD